MEESIAGNSEEGGAREVRDYAINEESHPLASNAGFTAPNVLDAHAREVEVQKVRAEAMHEENRSPACDVGVAAANVEEAGVNAGRAEEAEVQEVPADVERAGVNAGHVEEAEVQEVPVNVSDQESHLPAGSAEVTSAMVQDNQDKPLLTCNADVNVAHLEEGEVQEDPINASDQEIHLPAYNPAVTAVSPEAENVDVQKQAPKEGKHESSSVDGIAHLADYRNFDSVALGVSGPERDQDDTSAQQDASEQNSQQTQNAGAELEVITPNTMQAEHAASPYQASLSSIDSDSDSDSDFNSDFDSDDSDSSDDSTGPVLDVAAQANAAMSDAISQLDRSAIGGVKSEDDDDIHDEDAKRKKKKGGPLLNLLGKVRKPNTDEWGEPVLPIIRPEVKLESEDELHPLGEVERIVKLTVTIRPFKTGDLELFDRGTCLFMKDRSLLGAIYEVAGTIYDVHRAPRKPFYVVMFENQAELDAFQLEAGTVVYYTKKHAIHVFATTMMNIKADDNGDEYDIAKERREIDLLHQENLRAHAEGRPFNENNLPSDFNWGMQEQAAALERKRPHEGTQDFRTPRGAHQNGYMPSFRGSRGAHHNGHMPPFRGPRGAHHNGPIPPFRGPRGAHQNGHMPPFRGSRGARQDDRLPTYTPRGSHAPDHARGSFGFNDQHMGPPSFAPTASQAYQPVPQYDYAHLQYGAEPLPTQVPHSQPYVPPPPYTPYGGYPQPGPNPYEQFPVWQQQAPPPPQYWTAQGRPLQQQYDWPAYDPQQQGQGWPYQGQHGGPPYGGFY